MSVLAVLGVAPLPGGVEAQETATFRIQSISGQLAGSFDGSWVDWDVVDTRSVTRWQEWLELRIGGFAIHPRVASFQVAARPLLAQGRYLPAVDSQSSSGSGNALTGNVRIDLFPASTLSGVASGRRTDGFQRSGFGGTQRQALEEWGVELRDNDRRMPARLSYAERDERRDWNTGLSARRVVREESTRTFSYRAQSSKTRVFLEQRDYRRAADYFHLGGTRPGAPTSREDLHFLQRQGQATHQLRWGKGSRLFSQLRYIERTHDLAFRSFTWSESATLRQSRTITSDISGTWTRQSSPFGEGSTTGGHYVLRFQPDATLRLEVDAETRRSRSGTVIRTSSGVGPRATVALALPAGARVNARAHASYRWNSQDTGDGLFAEAVQEAHRPNAAGLFQLDNPFVDPMSVVIFSASGDQVYEEGLDFRVVLNDPFVEIHVLPGGRIAEGETVLVDYRYELVPRASGRGLMLGYDVTLSAGPMTLGARRIKQQDLGVLSDLPPGTARFLGDEDRSDLSATLSHSLGRLVGTVSAHQGRYSSRAFKTRSRSIDGRVSVVLMGNLTLTSSATYQSVRGGTSDYLIRQAEEALRWQLNSFVRLTGIASYWRWVQADRDERLRAAGVSMEVGRFRRTFTFRYDFGDWQNGNNHSEHRVSLGLSQRF